MTHFISFGGEIDEVHVSFVLAGDNLDPSSVTNVLGIAPSRVHARGDPMPKRPALRYRTGVWCVESDLRAAAPLAEHICHLLDLFEPKATAIRSLLQRGITAEVQCGLFLNAQNRGTSLSPETLSRVGTLGASLELDIYSPVGDA